ncbi:MAG TPA: tetrahydrofolate dehydrogenase/cyclohydrolase catalytic domain-containing protein, partial [Pseudogracilibacillus sp.]|nr:tetrahydrofolate dehydrogenase/cyclohydrolase catalytic domain-containing protein [Pseudogracilibacillus sp.]
MSAEVINGLELAGKLREEMKQTVSKLNKEGIEPKLTVILIGDDPASHSYVNGKNKASAEVGINSEIIRHDASISEAALL